MLNASALLQEAARYSRTLSCRVDVYHGQSRTHSDVPVTAGTLTADRTRQYRLGASLTLAMTPDDATGIDTRHCRFKVHRGVESIGVVERMQLGEFRVDEVSRNETGLIQLTGSGLESYVIDARFIRPRTPPRGTGTLDYIATLIREAVPSAMVRMLATTDRLITATAPWDSERWDAIDALAASINTEVFVNAAGEFVIADAPSLDAGVPVYLVNEGDGGVLVGRAQKDTRDQVYNAVSVSGSSTDPNVLPVWAWSYDNNPGSDTYYFADPLIGGYGQVPRFYESQFFNTDAQCQVVADELLAQSLAANKTLNFSTTPLSFLEVGDTVTVQMQDGTFENHLLNKLDCTLDVTGALACETLSSKVIARAVL
jgi:hypothetical protein